MSHSSLSTGGRLRGRTTIMPIIPALVCMSTGCVAQRHMKAPGCLATKRIVMRLPGATSMQFLLGVRQLIDRIREHVRIWLR